MEIPVRVGISPTLHIRSLLASRPIVAEEVIEHCPVVLIPTSHDSVLEPTVLGTYYFEWNDEHSAIAFGYGSLMNHSYTPNVRFVCNFAQQSIDFIALRDIAEGEELCTNYNGDPHDTDVVDERHVDFHAGHKTE